MTGALRAWPPAAPGREQDPAVSVRAVFAWIGRRRDLLLSRPPALAGMRRKAQDGS